MTESRIQKHKYRGDKAFNKWLKAGIDNGFCTPSNCQTHEGVPLEEWEEAEFDEGYDPCVVVMRLLGPYAPPVDAPDYSAFRNEAKQ